MTDRPPNTHCRQCEVAFYALPHNLCRGRGRFCSVRCKSVYGRSKQDTRGDKNPNWAGGVWKINTKVAATAWNKNNPLKRRAHHMVQHEVKMGRMTRGPCECCGGGKSDAHHDDYSLPLVVRWLCRSCHLKHHRSVDDAASGPSF